MADKELVQEWIRKADEDFGYAAQSLDEEFEYFPQICWHFQQAAEKYLKAFIVAYDLEFKKIHDLLALLKICTAKDSALGSLADECRYLQKFYIEARYPVVWETKWKRDDALMASEAAKKIADFVRKKV